MSKARARKCTDQIRKLIGQTADAFDEIPRLVIEAKQNNYFDELGYGTWEDYVKAEFGTDLLRLPKAGRKEWSRQLKDAGMSTREIAPVVNASVGTVHADTHENDLPVQDRTPRSTSDDDDGYIEGEIVEPGTDIDTLSDDEEWEPPLNEPEKLTNIQIAQRIAKVNNLLSQVMEQGPINNFDTQNLKQKLEQLRERGWDI